MNTSLLMTINGWAGQHSWLDKLMVFIASDLIYLVFLATAICMGYLLYKRQFATVAWFVGSLALSYVLLKLAGHMYVDHRPFVDHKLTQLLPHAAGSSFPSDHTTVTTAIGMSLLLLTRFKKTGAAIVVAAVIIGFSRIFVGVHYPVDIAGGLVVGTLGSVLMWGAMRRFGSEPRSNGMQLTNHNPDA